MMFVSLSLPEVMAAVSIPWRKLWLFYLLTIFVKIEFIIPAGDLQIEHPFKQTMGEQGVAFVNWTLVHLLEGVVSVLWRECAAWLLLVYLSSLEACMMPRDYIEKLCFITVYKLWFRQQDLFMLQGDEAFKSMNTEQQNSKNWNLFKASNTVPLVILLFSLNKIMAK